MTWLLCLLACGGVDNPGDSAEPVDSSASAETSGAPTADTSVSLPTATTGTTATTGLTGDTAALQVCNEGDAPTLKLGAGGQQSFSPFGDTIELTRPDAMYVEFSTTEFATAEGLYVVARITTQDAPSTDSIGSIKLLCAAAGTGWAGLWIGVPEGLSGSTDATLTVTLTLDDTSVHGEWSGSLRAP